MIGAILLALGTAASQAPGCGAARAAVPEERVCVEGQNGIAIGADEADARGMLDQAQVAEQLFRTTFGREPARYAVFSYDEPATARTAFPALKALGFRAVLPVASPALGARQLAELSSRLESQVGGGAAPQLVRREGASGGGGAPQIVRRGSAPGGGEPRGENTVAHELGHLWNHVAFWPDAMTSSTPRYGSPAPDWLDEAAAMLMENERGVRSYHQRFADGRSTEAARAASVPPEIPLAELTTMTHPAMVSIPAGGAGGVGTMVVTGRPTLFYAQTRIFVEYLADRSGEPRIVSLISEGARAGGTFDAWLSANGAKYRLPTSLAAMQTDWDAWLDRRFGPAPSDQ